MSTDPVQVVGEFVRWVTIIVALGIVIHKLDRIARALEALVKGEEPTPSVEIEP
jgi:hypothetical protein